MKISNTSTPLVLLNGKLGALGAMRTLGPHRVPLYTIDADPLAPASLSRYCRKRFPMDLNEDKPREMVDFLLGVSEKINGKPILLPTSDETAHVVAQYQSELQKYFIFPHNNARLIERMMNKKEMFDLAREFKVPTPFTEFPTSLGDVESYIARARFPVILKAILGNRLMERTGKKMVIVNNEHDLIANFKLLDEPGFPNLMLQECIPGGDDEVYIFNGYFDKNSNCLSPFTGHKIRQHPVHVGCASLGACIWNEDVSRITTDFMKAIGYRGILDIGYRLDPRDGLYKVLDINPRIGQAFRMFVGYDGNDVAYDLYLDLTGQPRKASKPREGRRWLIEDYDLVSSYDYYCEGTLTIGQWLRSFKGLEEGVWYNSRDLRPFFNMLKNLTMQVVRAFWKRLKSGLTRKTGEKTDLTESLDRARSRT